MFALCSCLYWRRSLMQEISCFLCYLIDWINGTKNVTFVVLLYWQKMITAICMKMDHLHRQMLTAFVHVFHLQNGCKPSEWTFSNRRVLTCVRQIFFREHWFKWEFVVVRMLMHWHFPEGKNWEFWVSSLKLLFSNLTVCVLYFLE